MPTIIKKGTNPSAFRLKSGKTILINVERGGGDILNFVSEDDFKALMHEYGSFITPRVISDKNPKGCFIVSADRNIAKDMGKEIGFEVKDNSAQIEIKDETSPEIPTIEVSKPIVGTKPETPAVEEISPENAEIGFEVKDNSEENVKRPQEVEEKSKKGKK